MQKPKQAFRHHPLNRRTSHKENFSWNINFKKNTRGKVDSYHSFAPEITYIKARTDFDQKTLSILVSSVIFFFSVCGLSMSILENLSLFLFAICLAIILVNFFLIIDGVIKQKNRKKGYQMILSQKGLQIKSVLHEWNKIKDEKIIWKIDYTIHHRKRKPYLFFRIPEIGYFVEYPLDDFELELSELEYLLQIYRCRSEGKIIPKEQYYEKKYMNLSQKSKDKYIIG